MGQSIWSSMQQKGYSRRDFLQFCAAAATVAGFGQSGVAQVVSAFEKEGKTGCRLDALPGVHLLQRVLHPRLAPHRASTRCSTCST